MHTHTSSNLSVKDCFLTTSPSVLSGWTSIRTKFIQYPDTHWFRWAPNAYSQHSRGSPLFAHLLRRRAHHPCRHLRRQHHPKISRGNHRRPPSCQTPQPYPSPRDHRQPTQVEGDFRRDRIRGKGDPVRPPRQGEEARCSCPPSCSQGWEETQGEGCGWRWRWWTPRSRRASGQEPPWRSPQVNVQPRGLEARLLQQGDARCWWRYWMVLWEVSIFAAFIIIFIIFA